MGIPTGNHVNSSGITRAAFKESLEQQGVREGSKKFEQAMSIFNKYASLHSQEESGNEVLDAEEQGLVRNAMNEMDTDENESVSRKEYNQSDANRELQQDSQPKITYKGYKAFASALNGTTENGNLYNDEIAVTENYNGNDFSIVDKNDNVSNYRVEGRQAESTQPDDYTPPEPPQETPNSSEPVVYYTFKNMEDAYSNVYYYLLGRTDINLGENNELLNNLKIKLSDPNDSNSTGLGFRNAGDFKKEELTVTYHGKDYIMKRTKAGVITIERRDGENTVTLRDDILNEESTDRADHYHNRHGNANSGSRYDGTKFVINNTSARRQHVSTVQTFSSMLLNNDTSATLQIDKDFNADAVINVINVAKKSDDAHKNEISLTDLLKYLNAAIQEAETTVEKLKGKNMGTRTYAANVDMDMKDLANLGLVFKKFDADNNGFLNKVELENLIQALIKERKTMTFLAKEQNNVEQPVKPEPTEPNIPVPDVKPFEAETEPSQQTEYGGRVSGPDRTRNVAGTNKKEQVQYMYNDGRRTLVESVGNEYRTVLNANIAEYEDHGPLGAGRKDFIKIDGLRSNVRAEVVRGTLEHDMVIKIKDANGTVTYRKISYDAKTQSYKLGELCDEQGNVQSGKSQTATQLLQALGMDSETMEVPEGLIVKKKHGKNVYYLNGHKVAENVAKAHVLAYNAANNPTYINGFNQAVVPKSYGVHFGGKLFYGTVTVNTDSTLTLTSEYKDKSKVTFKFNSLDDLRAGKVSEYTHNSNTVKYEYVGTPPKPTVVK